MKAVVFDFDGVLADSLQLNFDIKRAVFESYGTVPTRQEFIDIWVSPRNRENEGIPYFIKLKGLKVEAEELKAKQKPIYEKLFAEGLEMVPGAAELVGFFRARNIPLGIVSSNSRYSIEVGLKRFGLEKEFEFIVSSRDCGFPKPHPAPYLKAVEMFGVSADQVLVLEDSDTGVESAKAAGCRVIALPNEFTRAEDFSKADFVAKSIGEITEQVLERF